MELNEILVASPPSVSNMSQEINLRNLNILEEGPRISQEEMPVRSSQEINIRNLRIVEEGPRVCPICSQEVRSYFINYTEKVEMCENLECDYPFAYEPLKIIREENGIQIVEVKSGFSKKGNSTGGSQVSNSAWSDLDKLCNVSAPSSPGRESDRSKPIGQVKKSESQRRKEELLRNVEKIKQMTKSMNEMNKESKGIIKNEKWIQNLQYLQGLSGVNLLRPEEMKKIKSRESLRMSGELKIDIDKNNMSNIKIEVNHAKPSKKLV